MPPFLPPKTDPTGIVDKLLTLPEVRGVVGLSSATLYRMIERGDFPRPVKIGRAARWPTSEVTAFIEKHKTGRPTSSSPENM
jgi:prophage regulatory protein